MLLLKIVVSCGKSAFDNAHGVYARVATVKTSWQSRFLSSVGCAGLVLFALTRLRGISRGAPHLWLGTKLWICDCCLLR